MLRKNLTILSLLSLTLVNISIFAMDKNKSQKCPSEKAKSFILELDKTHATESQLDLIYSLLRLRKPLTLLDKLDLIYSLLQLLNREPLILKQIKKLEENQILLTNDNKTPPIKSEKYKNLIKQLFELKNTIFALPLKKLVDLSNAAYNLNIEKILKHAICRIVLNTNNKPKLIQSPELQNLNKKLQDSVNIKRLAWKLLRHGIKEYSILTKKMRKNIKQNDNGQYVTKCPECTEILLRNNRHPSLIFIGKHMTEEHSIPFHPLKSMQKMEEYVTTHAAEKNKNNSLSVNCSECKSRFSVVRINKD